MPFNLSAGLSSAGAAVVTTSLENQKADLEMEKVKLADQLAGARQEKQNVFTTSERVATQGFTGEENTKNRTNALDIANLQAKTAITTAGIGAGATMGAAQLSAQTSRDNLAATLAQNKPLIDIEVLGKSIAAKNATDLQGAKQELIDARASNDPDKIKAAIQKEADLSLGADKNIQVVAQYQAAQKMAQQMYTELNGKVATLSASPMASTPEVKAQIDLFSKAAEKARQEYEVAKRMSEQAQSQLPVGMPQQPGNVIQYDASGNRVQAAPTAPAAAPPPVSGVPGGLINTREPGGVP